MSKEPRDNAFKRFFLELQRRRVIRVVIFYAVTAWILIEISSTVLPALNLPGWTITLVVVLLALGFPVAVIMAWAFDIGPDGFKRTRDAVEDEQKKTHDERRSLAVLPFTNMSGDADNEYFSDGISEELLNLLVKLPQLRVSSRTSSFAFKGQGVDITTVAEKLNVSTVLEGSVRRAGDRMRITAQLIDTETDSPLWSETYDREFKDVFEVQDDIARKIVQALEVTLNPKERRALASVATADAEAYDFYLRGRRYFYRMTKRNLIHALQMYEKAIDQDPKYALAYAGIADCHSFLYMYGDATKENLARADEASQRALELDPDSAEAHASRGIALSISEQYQEAEQEFERAILQNPRLFEAYYFYARDCLVQGKSEKAARLFAQASEVNPTDYQSPHLVAQVYAELGREQDAEAAHRRAVSIIEQHLESHPDDARALYLGAASSASLGDRDRAVEWAKRAIDTERDEPAVLYNAACVYAMVGETDKAFECLASSVDMGFGYRAWIENDASLVSLRKDPRFEKILKRL